jgi:glycerophosphoryl diester phosphodiesterase
MNLAMWPAVVAHRGASAQHPENTLDAFEAAVDAGADIVEFDVRRSADGALVVAHDATELTLAEIKRLQPEIPTLDEVLEQLHGRVALEVEIKNAPAEAGYEPAGATVARDVVAALRRHAFADAFVASFDAECLRSVEELDPATATGLLVEPVHDLGRALEIAAGRHAFLLPEATALERAGRTFIDAAHDRGVRVCTWTGDDAPTIERLFELGADAVETNDPALGVRVRDSLYAQG